MKKKSNSNNMGFNNSRNKNEKASFVFSDGPVKEKLGMSNLRWMFPYIKEHWKLGGVGAIGMMFISLLSLPAPYLMKIIIDKVIVGKDIRLLNIMILVMFGIQIFVFGASWITNYSFNRFSIEIVTRIKKDLFYKILRFPISFFIQNQTGYIMSRIGEVEGLNFFFSSTLINVVISIFRFFFCIMIMISLNARLTMLALIFIPIYILVARWSSKDIRKISWQYIEKSAIINRGIQDSLSGIEIVKTFGAETREATKFQFHLDGLKDMNIRRTVIMSLYSESLSLIGASAGFVILWWSGLNIITEQFSIGSYMAFSAYLSQLFGPTQMIANIGLMLQPAKIALRRIHEIFNIVAEDESGGTLLISSLKRKIEFHDVYFEYEKEKPILSKVNLEINPGEKILILGPNGAGKSTIIKLVMGFYNPQGGEILISGKPLNAFSLVSLRERISIVSQNTFLFSDTIRNNVLYSAPGTSDEELNEALKFSGAMEIVRKMERGIDTEIGERGIRLSSGERQKLSIARAILRKSDLIIFDEATTHLDNSSILLLNDIIKSRFANTTCLMISHRPIDIPIIDRVYRIERGSVREIGNRAEYNR